MYMINNVFLTPLSTIFQLAPPCRQFSLAEKTGCTRIKTIDLLPYVTDKVVSIKQRHGGSRIHTLSDDFVCICDANYC